MVLKKIKAFYLEELFFIIQKIYIILIGHNKIMAQYTSVTHCQKQFTKLDGTFFTCTYKN